MKKIIVNWALVVVLVGAIVGALTLTYNEPKWLRKKTTETTLVYQKIYLYDEKEQVVEFVWDYSLKKQPITKVENMTTYYLCKHYCFLRSEYKLEFN